MNIGKPKDFISGIALLLLGFSIVFMSLEFPIWIDGEPQEGFFPLFTGAAIIILSCIVIYGSLSKKDLDKTNLLQNNVKEPSNTKKLVIYAISITTYGLLINATGFFLSSILFLLITLKLIEKMSWITTIFVTFFSIFASYYIFTKLLGVPLPKGLFNF